MRRYLINVALFSITPLILLVLALAGYVITDPFRVLYRHDDYTKDMFVIPSRDYVSSEVYIKNKDARHYDSFIFGSSRTVAFQTRAWANYLGDSASPYAFDAYSESFRGIADKLRFIDQHGGRVRNAIILVCRDHSFERGNDESSILLVRHPAVAHTSWLRFHGTFLRGYLNGHFLASYYLYMITGKFVKFMSGYIEERQLAYDPVTNDAITSSIDQEIAKDPEGYYRTRARVFYPRSDSSIVDTVSRIDPDQRMLLAGIRDLFLRHRTRYAIIIAPLYDQVIFNRRDKAALEAIFGPGNVHDYSGKSWITDDIHNYYDNSHFKPFIGDSIMHDIYRKHDRIAAPGFMTTGRGTGE